MANASFFEKPYDERQLVVFVDYIDEGIGLTIVKLIAISTSPILMPVVGVGLNILSKIIPEKKGTHIVEVEKSQRTLFQLPPGHPRDKVVYVGHPLIPNKYMPLADFHRRIFEDKFLEVVSLLKNLAAHTIRVEHSMGSEERFSARAGVNELSDVTAGIGVSFQRDSQQRALYYAVLVNEHPPRLPTDLVWYYSEPTWQAIANDRLNLGLREFTLVLNYKEDFGINAELGLKLQKAGLSLGGDFKKMKEINWNISGNFYK